MVSLLQEIKSGASDLERDDVTGKVRRVVCSSLVQVKAEGKEGSGPEGAVASQPNGMYHVVGAMQSIKGCRGLRSSSCGLCAAVCRLVLDCPVGLGDVRSMVNYRADRGVWEVLHSDTASCAISAELEGTKAFDACVRVVYELHT